MRGSAEAFALLIGCGLLFACGIVFLANRIIPKKAPEAIAVTNKDINVVPNGPIISKPIDEPGVSIVAPELPSPKPNLLPIPEPSKKELTYERTFQLHAAEFLDEVERFADALKNAQTSDELKVPSNLVISTFQKIPGPSAKYPIIKYQNHERLRRDIGPGVIDQIVRLNKILMMEGKKAFPRMRVFESYFRVMAKAGRYLIGPTPAK